MTVERLIEEPCDHTNLMPCLSHGLYYVDRDNADTYGLYSLSHGLFPDVRRPERDVLMALLRYAIDRLEAQAERPRLTNI